MLVSAATRAARRARASRPRRASAQGPLRSRARLPARRRRLPGAQDPSTARTCPCLRRPSSVASASSPRSSSSWAQTTLACSRSPAPAAPGRRGSPLQAAAALRMPIRTASYWVPLAPLRDPALVLATAGHSARIEEWPRRAHLRQDDALPLRQLRAGRGCRAELAGLLAECPNLDVLVTSRERLRVSGRADLPGATARRIGRRRRSSRVRARAVDPAFTPSESIRELCLRLDELPLALELAAARTALFSPEQLLERALRASRPAQGRSRRRSTPADAARDDRVVV